MGFGGALQLLLIAFKLLGVVSWSWGLVLMPLWVGLTVLLVGCVILYKTRPPAIVWWSELLKRAQDKAEYERVQEALKKED